MMRPRGGFTSYVGYGALTLILMYVLFLYNATKNGLNSCEVEETKLRDDKKELLSHLSVAHEYSKRMKASVADAKEAQDKCTAARKESELDRERCLRESNDVKIQLKNKESELSRSEVEGTDLRTQLQDKTEDCAQVEQKSLKEYEHLRNEREQIENNLQDELAKKTAEIQRLQNELTTLKQQQHLAAEQQKNVLGNQQQGNNAQQQVNNAQQQGNNAQQQGNDAQQNNQLANSFINNPGVANNNPGVANNNPGVANNNPGVANNNPGVANNNPGFVNNNPGFVNNNQGFVNNNPGIVNNNPQADSNQQLLNINPGVDDSKNFAVKETQVEKRDVDGDVLADKLQSNMDNSKNDQQDSNNVNVGVFNAPTKKGLLNNIIMQSVGGADGMVDEGRDVEKNIGRNGHGIQDVNNMPGRYKGRDAEMADGALRADTRQTTYSTITNVTDVADMLDDTRLKNKYPQQPLGLQEDDRVVNGGDMLDGHHSKHGNVELVGGVIAKPEVSFPNQAQPAPHIHSQPAADGQVKRQYDILKPMVPKIGDKHFNKANNAMEEKSREVDAPHNTQRGKVAETQNLFKAPEESRKAARSKDNVDDDDNAAQVDGNVAAEEEDGHNMGSLHESADVQIVKGV